MLQANRSFMCIFTFENLHWYFCVPRGWHCHACMFFWFWGLCVLSVLHLADVTPILRMTSYCTKGTCVAYSCLLHLTHYVWHKIKATVEKIANADLFNSSQCYIYIVYIQFLEPCLNSNRITEADCMVWFCVILWCIDSQARTSHSYCRCSTLRPRLSSTRYLNAQKFKNRVLSAL